MATHSEFGKSTTGTQVAEAFKERIRGKTVLITGPSPNSIGEATALAIARQAPALLILAARSPAKLDVVAADCREAAAAVSSPFNKATRVPESDPYNVRQSGQGNSTKVEMVVVDLSSQSSVRFAAREIASLTSHIDILLNNAGVSLSRGRSLSPEGIEQTFATNHVGHFLLTTLLLPLLQSAPSSGAAARVVNVSSLGHRLSPVRFSDINFDNEVEGPRKGKIDVPKDELPRWERLPAWSVARAPDGFPGPIAYGMSKSANILFTIGLKTRGIASLAVHPGEILTNLTSKLSPEWTAEIEKLPADHWKTTDQGCATTLVAAFDPELCGSNHLYLGDCQIVQPARWASDPDKAERLWRVSEELVAGSESVVTGSSSKL